MQNLQIKDVLGLFISVPGIYGQEWFATARAISCGCACNIAPISEAASQSINKSSVSRPA
jgi:hypothetical protein